MPTTQEVTSVSDRTEAASFAGVAEAAATTADTSAAVPAAEPPAASTAPAAGADVCCCEKDAGRSAASCCCESESETDSIAGEDSAAQNAEAALCCCHSAYKATPRDAAFQADLQKRLNRAIGQLNGVKAMIDDNRYCGDVLTQLAAAESAIHRVSEMVLHNHLQTCVAEQIRAGNDEIVEEAMALIHKFGSR